MSIFLLILKIIGITLLCIIGILLLLILLILFVPLKYKIAADKYNDKEFTLNIKVTWLLHIINLLIRYTDDLYYVLKLFVFPLKKSENLTKKKKNKEEKNKKEIPENEEGKDDINFLKTDEKIKNPEYNQDKSEMDFNDTDKDSDTFEKEKVSDSYSDKDNDSDKDDENMAKEGFFEKLLLFIQKVFEFIFKCWDKINSFLLKIHDIKENCDYYIDAINDDRNQEAFTLCLKKLSDVLKNIKPRKIKGYVHLGSSDPYNMGTMMSIYGILFPLIRDKIQMVPDYENDITEFDLLIKGRITIFVILVAAFKIYFDRDVRRMVKIFKKED